jgi:hypothetical protein
MLQSCGCDEIITYCHSAKSLSLKSFDNGGTEPVPTKDGQVMAKALLFKLDVEESIEVCANKMNNPFSMAAYAFKKPDCTPDEYTDTLSRINVYSDKDFNADYLAGKDLSKMFKMTNAGNGPFTETKEIYLLKEPADTGTHIFTVEVLFINGKRLEVQSDPIKLLK